MHGWMGVGFFSVGCCAAVSTELGEYSLFPWRRSYTSSALESFYMRGCKEWRLASFREGKFHLYLCSPFVA